MINLSLQDYLITKLEMFFFHNTQQHLHNIWNMLSISHSEYWIQLQILAAVGWAR